MSNVQDISGWMDKIQRATWESFGYSCKGIMNTWAYNIAMRMQLAKRGYPSTEPLRMNTGNLGRAFMDGTDDGIMEDSAIVYTRTINSPYAAISEYGKSLALTRARIAAIMINVKKLGRYNPAMRGHKTTIDHPAFKYVESSVKEFDINKIAPIVKHFLEVELSKIPNLEVVSGKG
jgi:hypothetical protein